MTQQVVHVRSIFTPLDLALDRPSVGMTFEEHGTSSGIDVTAVEGGVHAFWSAQATNLGPSLTTNYDIAVYDVTAHLSGTPAGSPIDLIHTTLPSVGSQFYAEGVSAVVSYRSDYGSDTEFAPGARPRARHRNRFYMPPLSRIAFDEDGTTHRTRLYSGFVTGLLTAVAGHLFDLGGADGASHNADLVVWSRTNSSVAVIQDIWMDDRPDYQRRRTDPSGIRTHQAPP